MQNFSDNYSHVFRGQYMCVLKIVSAGKGENCHVFIILIQIYMIPPGHWKDMSIPMQAERMLVLTSWRPLSQKRKKVKFQLKVWIEWKSKHFVSRK